MDLSPIVLLPSALIGSTNRLFSLHPYVAKTPSVKNKILLEYHMISLLQHGEKVLTYAHKTSRINADQIIALAAGNCLMSEKLAVQQPYSSLLFFFSPSALADFFIQYSADVKNAQLNTKALAEPFVAFRKDDFIRSYIASLATLAQTGSRLSDSMLQLKFNELMLYLLEKNPQRVLAFQAFCQQEPVEFDIRKTVELHITNPVTIDELAFLCNMSVSTFKRRFLKLYQTSPSHYLRQRKLELAASLLMQGESPSAVFYKVGFENHSSFSQSFKQQFQISPSQYQQRKMAN